jgi:hypothetical protein
MVDATPPAPLAPGVPPVPPIAAVPAPPKSGCLKWGLIGCAGASVALIVGLLFLLNNAKGMMDWAMTKMSDQVLDAAGPDVTPADREAFTAAFQVFREKGKAGKLTPSQIQDFQKKTVAAVSDGKVTAGEMRDLTAALRNLAR